MGQQSSRKRKGRGHINKVILVGRLTRDPDIHQANDKKVARFTIAVDRRFKQEGGESADFPSIVAFGKTAEFIEKYFYKGMKIALDGRLQTGSYKNRDGNTVYTTDVIAENVEFAESKKANDEQMTNDTVDEWVQVPDDDGLPF